MEKEKQLSLKIDKTFNCFESS
jgi:hypothetical protein